MGEKIDTEKSGAMEQRFDSRHSKIKSSRPLVEAGVGVGGEAWDFKLNPQAIHGHSLKVR